MVSVETIKNTHDGSDRRSPSITKFPKIVLGIIKSDQVYHAHHANHNATCLIRSDIVWDLLYGVDQRRLFVPSPRSHSPE